MPSVDSGRKTKIEPLNQEGRSSSDEGSTVALSVGSDRKRKTKIKPLRQAGRLIKFRSPKMQVVIGINANEWQFLHQKLVQKIKKH